MVAYNWNPITEQAELSRYQGLSYPALGYALMGRMGMPYESSFGSTISNDIMPLMATLLETFLKAKGLQGGNMQGGQNSLDTVNNLGRMLSQVMQPNRAIPGQMQQLGTGNLAQKGLGYLQELAKGGFNEGSVQDVALSDTNRLWGLASGLMGNQLGGSLGQQFFNQDVLSRLQAQFAMRGAGGSNQNWLAFLQQMGWMPGDYTQSKETVPDPFRDKTKEPKPQDEQTPQDMKDNRPRGKLNVPLEKRRVPKQPGPGTFPVDVGKRNPFI